MREKRVRADRRDAPPSLPVRSSKCEAGPGSSRPKAVGLCRSVPQPSSSNRAVEASAALPAVAQDALQEESESFRLVRAFRRETDRWTRERPVAVSDAENFARQFAAVPSERRMECLHRALNLIPDANVALLAGILFDKSQPREVLKATFNDIVNRSEEAKEPIVKAVYRDKTHPCCDDATWIYEVTGEKPE